MFIAYLETAAGQISIGLVDISKNELEGPLQPLDALVSALVASAALSCSPARARWWASAIRHATTLTFKYLGTRSVELPSGAAFHESANAYLASGVYECPDTFKTAEDGTFRAQCKYFQLLADESALGATPTVH